MSAMPDMTVLLQDLWFGWWIAPLARLNFLLLIKVLRWIQIIMFDVFWYCFSNEDVRQLFPGDSSKDMVFHQDSASSHMAKNTLNCLRSSKCEQYMPRGMDA